MLDKCPEVAAFAMVVRMHCVAFIRVCHERTAGWRRPGALLSIAHRSPAEGGYVVARDGTFASMIKTRSLSECVQRTVPYRQCRLAVNVIIYSQ